MNLPDVASQVLCLFASVLLATGGDPAARGRWRLLPLVAGFALVALPSAMIHPAAPVLALLAGAAALFQLLRSPRSPVALGLAGACAGLAAASWLQVIPFAPVAWVMIPLCLAVPVATAWLAGLRHGFASQALRDQGQCAVVIAAPLVAALQGATSGWQSALALSAAPAEGGAPSPGWWLALPLLALAAGMLRQAGARR